MTDTTNNIISYKFDSSLSESEHDEIISTMANNMNYVDNPQIGIFWYDPYEDELVGVSTIDPDEMIPDSEGRKISRKLHKDYWNKQKNKLKYPTHTYNINRIFTNDDYTQVPRGRVIQNKNETFQIIIGSWINNYPQVIDYIKDEFNLNNCNVKVIYDHHYDIGNECFSN